MGATTSTDTNQTEPTPPDLSALILAHGSHHTREQGVCLMEAVAWFANEPHSDAPTCASPVLAAIGIRLNDRWSDDERQLLKPFILKLVGTRDPSLESRRVYVYVDHIIRSILPAALRQRKLEAWDSWAHQLANLDPIADKESALRARDKARELRAFMDAAADAAYAAADAAAYAAAAYAADADAAAAADAYKLSKPEREEIRKAARREIVGLTLAAFQAAIDVGKPTISRRAARSHARDRRADLGRRRIPPHARAAQGAPPRTCDRLDEARAVRPEPRTGRAHSHPEDREDVVKVDITLSLQSLGELRAVESALAVLVDIHRERDDLTLDEKEEFVCARHLLAMLKMGVR